MARESNIQKALRLQKEAAVAKKAAIGDLLEQRRAIDAKLQELGHVSSGAPVRARHSRVKTVRTRVAARASKPCKVCGKTGHDGRHHRWDKQRTK